ncbi:MAG: hypothetical protein J5548_10490 [Prevotella sp.]|nr:hypothetical protein [Prevotella sp.]
MGSFFEEIIKGGLGSVFGGGSSSSSDDSGGFGDIVKEIQKKMGGDTSSTTNYGNSSRNSSDFDDVAEEIRRQAGKAGKSSSSSTSTRETSSKTNSSTRETSSRTSSSNKESGGINDILNEMKRRAGFNVEEEEDIPVENTTRRSTKKEVEQRQKEAEDQGSILGGINLGNIGDIVGGILKSILLGGRSL